MKKIILCILMCKAHFLIAQKLNDTNVKEIQYATPNWNNESQLVIKQYIDSINHYTQGQLPLFFFQECLDWNASLWPGLHTPISIRWEILSRVNNRMALNTILKSGDVRLKKRCTNESGKVYPYLKIPMIELSFYQLIQKRIKQLKH